MRLPRESWCILNSSTLHFGLKPPANLKFRFKLECCGRNIFALPFIVAGLTNAWARFAMD